MFNFSEWSWWKMYTKVKPLLNVTRTDEELKMRQEEAKEWQEAAMKEKQEKQALEASLNALLIEKQQLAALLDQEKSTAQDQAAILDR